MLVRFREPERAHEHLSAAAVIEGSVLAGRIGFVGSSAAGLKDLHDIVKVGVCDQILLKPSRLTLEQFEEMKRHSTCGDDTLEIAERSLGDDSFLRIAREFALTHQDKWDGSGYSQGLAGKQIPVAGRLMAVADVYDALVSRRICKEHLSHEQAAATLTAGRGTHFDPDVVDAFLGHQEQFREIAAPFPDAASHG